MTLGLVKTPSTVIPAPTNPVVADLTVTTPAFANAAYAPNVTPSAAYTFAKAV